MTSTHSEFNEEASASLKLEKLSEAMLQSVNVLRSTEPKTSKSMLPQFAQISDFLCDTIKLDSLIFRLQKELNLERREKRTALQRAEVAEKEVQNLKMEIGDLNAYARSANAEAKERTLEVIAERTKFNQLRQQIRDNLDKPSRMQANTSLSDDESKGANPLRSRCFRLLNTNEKTASTLRLVRRQKCWLMARNKALEEQLSKLYARGCGAGGARVLSKEELDAEAKKRLTTTRAFPSDSDPSAFKLMSMEQLEEKEVPGYLIEMAEDLLTTVIMNRGDPLAFLNCKVKVYSQQIRDVCIDIMGREFYALYLRNTRFETLIREVQRISGRVNKTRVVGEIAQAIKEALGCERATIWIVDSVRGFMWTKVQSADSSKQLTVQMPLPQPETDLTGIGLVSASYLSREIINVKDAHTDDRFNPKMDTETGFRTKSALCCPLFLSADCSITGIDASKGEPGVPKLMLQAINKSIPPGYFDGNDVYALNLLGSVAADVLSASESAKSNAANSLRKDVLLGVACDMMRRSASLPMILNDFQEALKVLFEAEACQLRLAYGDHTKEMESKANKIQLIDPPKDSTRTSGLVGEAIRLRMAQSCTSTQFVTDLRVNRKLDLEPPFPESGAAEYILHTVPVFEGTTLSFVLQFYCVIKDRKAVAEDDGTYAKYNPTHRALLNQLTQFLVARLDEFYPLADRLRTLRNWDNAFSRRRAIMMKAAESNLGKKSGAKSILMFESSSPR
eukprot:GEMP01010485.1.p1 GENE.GEMP01010485.1~~GEMP01010485.1.p1  ORF type:complete len:838 (+),score=168.83 GEMP01010485.1:311-2515(+)